MMRTDRIHSRFLLTTPQISIKVFHVCFENPEIYLRDPKRDTYTLKQQLNERKDGHVKGSEGGMIRLETLIEFFELILLLKSDKQFLVEQFEAAVSQSTVPSPPLKDTAALPPETYIYIYMYI